MDALTPVWLDPVDPSRAVCQVGYQASLLEDLQVLRDGGPGDRQLRRELSDRHWPSREALEDRAPGRVAQGAKCLYSVVSTNR